jgi:hypothetical protein
VALGVDKNILVAVAVEMAGNRRPLYSKYYKFPIARFFSLVT